MTNERHALAWLHLALFTASLLLLVACRDFVAWYWLAGIGSVVAAGLWWQQATLGNRPMPEWIGNLLGASIAVLGGAWAVGQAGELQGLPRPVALIPYLGLLVPLLMLIKLLKRQIPRDYWVLQGMGVVMAAIGCVLGLDRWEWALLPVYAFFALGGLRYRPGQSSWDARGLGLSAPGRPVLATLAIAAGIFFAIPRPDVPLWNPAAHFGQGGRASTGASNEMDLTGTGALDLDSEIAFEVDVRLSSGEPGNLNADSRFRQVELELYRAGRWRGTTESTAGRGIPMASNQLPALAANQMLLTFQIFSRDIVTPVVLDQHTLFLPVPLRGQGRINDILRRENGYQQIANRRLTPERIPVQDEVTRSIRREDLLACPPELREWSRQLILKLADDENGRQPLVGPLGNRPGRPGLLPRQMVGAPEGFPPSTPLPAAVHEEAARRLCDYLALSGDYTYSLDRRREDKSIDPAVDFLRNVRDGHCERFASGLALTLRSLGIPARVVKGFRGFEPKEEGVYIVRNYHAHSWVEVLVPRKDPGLAPGNPRGMAYEWLVLDPTPPTADPELLAQGAGVAAAARWVGLLPLMEWIEQHFQASLVGTLYGFPLLLWLVLGVLVVAIATGGILWGRWSRWLRANQVWPQWLGIAKRLGIKPAPGNTPREIAALAAAKFPEGNPSLRESMLGSAEFFYRLRFGGMEPTSPECLEEADRLLEQARRARAVC